ncbi:MAG: hypothetical protein EA368_05875 [Leptolyngbya sp. DLM2.Bin27]|nr:MAG: hypothetical protein EA368_05875 [Leptolyngbya sp. DLM2.Bin27]
MTIKAALSLIWRLAALALGVGLWGWWLAAFSAPPPFVGAVGLLLAYGLGVGWGSLVPISAAISMVVTAAVVRDIFPPFWSGSAPYKHWAYTLLALWVMGLAVTSLLAMVGDRLQKNHSMGNRWSRRLVVLAGLLISLWIGGRLYQVQWPSWVSWENL